MDPVILTVCREPSVRELIEAETRDRYSTGYELRYASSGSEALNELEQLADQGAEVALVLSAQALDDMPGTELHARSRRLHPRAKRTLVVPWGIWSDHMAGETILDSMA